MWLTTATNADYGKYSALRNLIGIVLIAVVQLVGMSQCVANPSIAKVCVCVCVCGRLADFIISNENEVIWTKLFHFRRVFKNVGGGGGARSGVKRIPSGSATAQSDPTRPRMVS